MPNKLPQLSQDASWLINAGIDDMQRYLDRMTGSPGEIADLEAALAHERSKPKLSGGSRVSRLKPMEAKLRKFQRDSTSPSPSLAPSSLSIPTPASLLTGAANTSLSPAEVAALAAVDTAWGEARRLADLAKDYARAGNAAKALCGLTLSRLREHYFGPRNSSGGRPKKAANDSGHSTWSSLLADRLGITDSTADVWMKMAEGVQAIAAAQGLDLQTTCAKLPWDWTPEETAALDNTFQLLCKDKTQRQLMQADFLESLGFENKQDKHGTNNPDGKNGGKKKPAASPKALLEERRRLARLDFFGTENPGKIKPGSPVWHIEEFLKNPAEHPLSLLPKPELLDLIEHTLTPFIKALKKLTL